MKNEAVRVSIAAIAALSILLMSCEKSESVEKVKAKGPFQQYGWSCLHNSTKKHGGCISNATYTATASGKNLLISGSIDSTGCALNISCTGITTPGIYGSSDGANISFIGEEGDEDSSAGNLYGAKLTIVTLNDTLIEAAFSGPLSINGTSETITITNGKVKALIDRETPCVR